MTSEFIFIFLLFIFWFIHISRRGLFFAYFFQLKEYRIDRFLEEAKRKKEIIFSKYFFLGIAMLLISLLFFSNEKISRWIATFVYLFLCLYSLYFLSKKKWQFPKFTKKMILWLGLIFVSQIVLFFVFQSIFFVLILEILFPLFIYLSLKIVQFFVFFTKKKIIQKAKIKRKEFKNLKVIGITGSYGKTSIKEILYELLKSKYKVVKTQKHTNTEIGVAKTVLNLEDADIFICEMGAYKRGEIKSICDIVKPEIGILTGINEQHLALFGNQENIIKGKYELIESLPENGLAIFNGENKYCIELFEKTNKKKLKYNFAKDIEVDKYGSKFVIDGVKFEIKLLGKHNVLNILGAIKIALELGISLEESSKICNGLGQELGGMVLKQGIDGLNIIDSSYSSNPDGVISALEYLNLWEGKKAIIIPGLIELGSASAEVHKRIEEKILKVCDVAITTAKGVFEKIDFVSSPEEIIKRLRQFSEQDDVVLLEGRIPRSLEVLLKRMTHRSVEHVRH
ncbi:UDP-N-acetylmuramoyl-tripeptide--D-alanyl-D-alanine ligase [Patescibacteria group bacterium]|nr:UDP-N-acetylmuramoyl-tripeptide--D-alanyl-D-alanine ligase [Patescibacteria group bacterium]MBU4023489.1 UDP-N-acetylmuramoyl-tripeptide--D-alanyl-D-alanine ligase [Patescibacteria group bacterium]MBU4078405.1 UDP-N-acetylmuramoyl-tripeptide--D-alanyl-D-alanine ligase [Patescibacteria group bacterium]